MPQEQKYFVVGATWNGWEDQRDKFFRRGCWLLGWPEDEKPVLDNRRDQMHGGDRIAIKKMNGKGADTITIRALGIIKEIDEDNRVYVDWLVTDIERIVPANGCFAAIHGPYKEDDPWVKEVFHI
jgi:hypothetical protein